MTDPTPDTPAVPEPVAYRCTEIEPLLPPNYEPIVKFTTDRELAEMRARRAGEWATEPLFSEAQMRAALDRAERAECGNIELEMVVEALTDKIEALEDRATTAEAALAEAGKVIEWYGENARLARLIHSEGDIGRWALAEDGGKRANQWLCANPAKETT